MIDITWMKIAGETITINPIVYFLWCIWNGWIFAVVGAFGGIMAGVGHISILGIGAWGKKLKGTPVKIGMYNDAGKYITDHIRFSNTALTWVNSLSATLNWYMQKRVVWPAALAMGVGIIVGAQAAVWSTGGALGIKLYKGLFGVCTIAVSFYMFYQLTGHAKARKTKMREATQRFKEKMEELKKAGRLSELKGIENVKFSGNAAEFDFYGEHFRVPIYLPLVYGFIVGFISALIGVGGGFLIVPFFTAINFPMLIAPATSALVVFLGQCSTLAGWFARGVQFVWPIVIGWAGIIIGSTLGTRTQKYLPMDVMYVIFGILALYVGARYIASGFFGIHLPP